jgi:mRNA-degrading endonuclease RelE of RelBE toxin-antitoxin system
MDKITKLLSVIPKKDRIAIFEALQDLYKKNYAKLDIKKLKNHESIYRIRCRNYRIIYFYEENKIHILKIQKRNESSYKNI